MDGGKTWHVCQLDHPEKPNKYGKYWCWCFWSLEVEVKQLVASKEMGVRAWDQTQNTQPEKLAYLESHGEYMLACYVTRHTVVICLWCDMITIK